MIEETLLEPELVNDEVLEWQARVVFLIRRATLCLAIVCSLGALFLGVMALLSIEKFAIHAATDLQSRRAKGFSKGVDLAYGAFEKALSPLGQEALAESIKVSGKIDTRVENIEKLMAFSREIRRVSAESSSLHSPDFSALTVFVSPLDQSVIPLNATADGRLDPAALKAVMARHEDISALMLLARKRAEGSIPRDRPLYTALKVRALMDQQQEHQGVQP